MKKLNHCSNFSNIIDIQKLEHESRKLLYLGFIIGILMHGIAGIFIAYKMVEITETKKLEHIKNPGFFLF